MNVYKNRKLFTVVCLLTVITWTNSAMASPIVSGNSFIPDPSFSSGDEIGYAAYDRNGGTSSDPWNTGYNNLAGIFSAASGSPSILDTSAEYLYLYQIINSTNGPVITAANIPTSPLQNDVTSAGDFSKLSFVYGSGIGAGIYVGNPPIITNTDDGFLPGGSLNPNYPYRGILVVPFFNPSVSLTDSNTRLLASISNPIGDSASYIFGFTSNAAPFSAQVGGVPVYAETKVTFNRTDVVAPGVVSIYRVPEPKTFSLILLGLFGIAFKKSRKWALMKQRIGTGIAIKHPA